MPSASNGAPSFQRRPVTEDIIWSRNANSHLAILESFKKGVAQTAGVLTPLARQADVAGAPRDEFDSLATQWFVVSDLGLTAFSGNDGIHAFVHSLDTTQPKDAVEVRLLSRGNEVLASKRTGDTGHVQFEPNLAREGPDVILLPWRRRVRIAT